MNESSRPTSGVSIVDPLSRALMWSRDVLFRPFDPVKWLVLGFCAWLAMLGQRGGNPGGSTQWQEGGDRVDLGRGLWAAWEWVLLHLVPVLFVVGFIVFVVVAIWLLFLWLSSRGKFMFLDGVVCDRGAVVEPWHRFRDRANALFGFRVVVGLIFGACVITFLAFIGLLVWLGAGADRQAPLLFFAGGLGLLVFLAEMLAFSLVQFAMNQFVVPLMYLRDDGVIAAWRELRGLFAARPGSFLLFLLVRILFAITVGLVSILACCLTCCIVLLPYVGTVILLPVWVFLRAFPLYFLSQFGPPYARFATLGPEAAPGDIPT